MSSDDYQVQNIYRYSRKSYKKNRRESQDEDICPRETINMECPESTLRSDVGTVGPLPPSCSCDIDPVVEISNILNKKCPVITLAQKQLKKLLDETDKLLCDNSRCCRSVYDFLCLCKVVLSQDRCRCFVIIIVVFSFLCGVLFGAASCGTYLGRFNSPIFQCVDNYFIPNSYTSVEDSYRSVV